jgi:hypothetical protein
MDENLINKTLKILNTETIDETLLDELQTKVCLRFFFRLNRIMNYKRFLKFFHQINIMVNLKQHHNI